MRIHEISRSIGVSLDGLVHESVAADPLEAARHRCFIGPHLVGGLCALALIPVTSVLAGSLSPFATVALAAIGLETLVAVFVSRTGRLGAGHLLSALCLTTLVAWVSLWTGGLSSFALVWLAFAPVEAALSGDRRTVSLSAVVAAAGLACVAMASHFGLMPQPLPLPGPEGLLPALAALLAVAYAAFVAIRIDRFHRESEQRFRIGESRYQLLADVMNDVVTCHAPNGDVAFASPAAGRLLGVLPSMLMADGLFRRVHVGDRPAYLSALSDAIHDGASEVEFRLRKSDEDGDDGFLWVEAIIRRQDASGSVAGATVTSVIRDIGRRKAQEAELMRTRAEAEEASFAKTRFLANVSHELRTPLNAIIGFSDLLGQEIFGRLEYERHREYVRLIHESGEHLLQVVNDILDMSKIEAGNFDVTPEPFDVASVMERCVQMVKPQADVAKLDLISSVEAGLPELVADRRAFRQIMLNLLSNAIKFTDANGTVVCGARRTGRSIAIFVKDNGIGIAAKDLPRLGNPFVQADSGYDRRHEGTGLGLSVVKGLVALHGGSMKIDSVLGSGTTVTVTLPIHLETETAPRAVSRAAGAEGASPSSPTRTAMRA
ncbi:sensor histidine kinase [Methylobrevis pamukkalensis]|uniref:sensor histidine kinase n=1 Tax=Methylobrevis pamukkalensis TaxID=1439726 RepID=UPI00114CB705|nr:PAS domain-containing sensor histidine kinase [Methylobrevis pamukkalensis]